MADQSDSSPPAAIALGAPRPAQQARERVIEVLSQNFATDRLDTDEFERRVTLAYQAPTSAELDRLIADLPAAVATADSTAAARNATVSQIRVMMSNNEQTGLFVVPARLEIVIFMGNLELDLSASTFTASVTEIDVQSLLGSVEITLPPLVRVECQGSAIVGSFSVDAPHASRILAGAGTRVVRVTGRAVLSSVQIDTAP